MRSTPWPRCSVRAGSVLGRTREFEDAFSSYVDARDCVAMSSGTAALQIAVRMLDLPPGSEVVTTALTFVASNQVIVQEGPAGVRRHRSDDGKRRFRFRRRVSDRPHRGSASRSLRRIPVRPRRAVRARDRATRRGHRVAHTRAGAVYRGRRIGCGDLHAFSFHAVKNLPTGDGGALTVRSPDWRRGHDGSAGSASAPTRSSAQAVGIAGTTPSPSSGSSAR